MSDDELLKQMPKLTTTLNAIRAHSPCEDVWKKLLAHLGKAKADDEPVPLRTILKSNGLDDALWCLRALPDEMDGAVRLLVCDLVEPAMVYVPAGETRPQAAIDAARAYVQGEISSDDLAAARAGAWAAARAAAWAARAAAAAWASRDAARAADWASAHWAARDAARAAAWDAVEADQERIFLAWLDKMEKTDE